MEPYPWRTGDAVLIEYQGRTVPGIVELASPNSVSLMLFFEAMLGGHIGRMPVLFQDGEYISIVELNPVHLTKPVAEHPEPS